MSELAQALVNGLSTGSVYALLALSIALVFSTMSAVNFATGSMGALSAFFFFGVGTTWGLGWVGGLAAALVGAAALGAVVERGIVRPIGQSGIFRLVLATMGLDILITGGTQLAFGSGVFNLDTPMPGGTVRLMGMTVAVDRLIILGVAVVGTLLLAATLTLTRLGRGIRAYAQDPLAAALMGIPDRTVSRWTWIISSLLGAVAAILVASVAVLSVGYLQGSFISAFTAAVLGGLARLPGAVAGGLILGVIEALSITYVPSELTGALPLLVIVVVLMVRPSGLFGRPSAVRA